MRKNKNNKKEKKHSNYRTIDIIKTNKKDEKKTDITQPRVIGIIKTEDKETNNFKENSDNQNSSKEKYLDDEIRIDEGETIQDTLNGERNYFNSKHNQKDNKKSLFLIKSKGRKRIAIQEYIEYILKHEVIISLNEELYKDDSDRGFYKKLNQHDFGVMLYQYIEEEHKRLIVDYDIGAMYRIMKIQPKIQVSLDKLDSNNMLINCENCLVDLERNEIHKHSFNAFRFNCINAKFIKELTKEEFKSSCFNKFLNSITNKDKELKKLIQEIFGYSISSINKAKKFFIFYGVPNSGKSTILDILNYIVGEENCSHIQLQKLVDDKYCAELFGKLLNTYNELPDEGLSDLGQIKALVSENDKVTARRLYNAPFSFKNKSTLIFATNNLPEIKMNLCKDNSALFKRLIIVPFLNSIPENEQDKQLFEKLTEEKNLIFRWSLEGINRLLNNDFIFSDCKISSQYLKEYITEEDLIGSFINENMRYKENGYTFWDEIKVKFKLYAKANEKSLVSAKEEKFLKKSIENNFGIKVRKLHRGNYNKLGFDNIKFI
ncbi:hypothetical protein LF65_00094 [Clostridium beijerinckii]|uniref:SF3 helicase domain-containing protein n=1 Tax=Clostridium beijerinckii TaxID=1520 RepID=A0A0B5Q740_CLOBE|nr:phage/plasmid primase, P4 family [Clostridium beijerinckii]AJG96785.1 hypothetical protein LF65_00094 [Clostridium beijerinckii]